jgi:hypothetical protein
MVHPAVLGECSKFGQLLRAELLAMVEICQMVFQESFHHD